MVEVVRPGCGEPVSAALRRLDQPRLVQVALGDHVDRASALPRLALDGVVQLTQEVHRRIVDDALHRVQAKPVESAAGARHPTQRVFDDEPSHRAGIGTVVVDRVSPGRAVARGEVRSELAQVVPLRSEVVVDDVEEGRESPGVRGVDQAREPGRPAVLGVGGEQVDAVVPPVPRAGEGGDGHHLHRGVAGPGKLREVTDRAVRGALARVRAEVDLGKDEPFQRVLRARRARRDGRQIHHFAGRVDAVGLQQRGGIGALASVRKAVDVARAWPHALHGGRVITLAVRIQSRGRTARDLHFERSRARRPHTEGGAMRTGDRAEPGLPGHAGEASSPIRRVPPAALLRRRRREHPRVADAELAAGLRLLELPAAHHLHHAQRQLAVAHAFRRGPDDASARSDVESRHELSLQRLPFLQPLLVAVADLAGVAADVIADQPPLLARGRRRSRFVHGGLLLDGHGSSLRFRAVAVAAAGRRSRLRRLLGRSWRDGFLRASRGAQGERGHQQHRARGKGSHPIQRRGQPEWGSIPGYVQRVCAAPGTHLRAPLADT